VEEFLDEMGRAQVSMARVFVEVDVTPGGLLQLTTKTAPLPTKPPTADQGGFEIRLFRKIPTLKASQFVRIALL
jgi:hypothetical protein